MASQFQILIVIIIFISCCPITHSATPCEKTYRACPSEYTCSLRNGIFCLKDGEEVMRSRWSLLENKCKKEGWSCKPSHYCLHSPDNKCILKDISVCDVYLDLMDVSECNNTFLTAPFEACSDYYLQGNLTYEFDAIIQCADRCLRNEISHQIYTKGPSCSELEIFAIKQYGTCWAHCGACFVPETWETMMKNHKKWGDFRTEVGIPFARECHKKYRDKQGKWTVQEIKTMSQNLLDEIAKHLELVIKGLFDDLINFEDSPSKLFNINIKQLEPWIYFGAIGILLIIVIVLLGIIYTKAKKKLETVYALPQLSQFGQTSYNDLNYEYGSVITSRSDGNTRLGMPMPSSFRRSLSS